MHMGSDLGAPINMAKSIMSEIIENGRVNNRPWIGIASIKITRQLAHYYQLPVTEGALIAQVEPYSPADDAGLRKGDIIEEIDGNRINDPSQVSSQVRKNK